ncbi:cytochrome b/b6 domain-containing protein [Methylophilus sp. Leaf408]|uniref:cytochrome b/b6 domain-containing protein n=1 Tax=Methylophilus sp. Leaf408 TaxID=2876561 RepID=UPI001E53E6CF|nr:cytochrome b/b6 domain-containing protein [Methylophilus sp. Leaf408]
MQDTTIKVWDLPLRLFHWLLVITVAVSYVSVKTDWLDVDIHWYAGLSITFLVLFRLSWGIVGTPTARFTQFFPTPRKLLNYFKSSWQGVGHTPTGALSVIALLLLLAGMVATGVIASDDITLQGPLAKYADETLSDQMSELHALLFNVLLGLIVLHVIAIVFYGLFKKDNLLKPMINGKKSVPLAASLTLPPIGKRLGWRLLFSVITAGALTWLLFSPQAHTFFYQPPPAPVVPASQHAW